MHFASDNTAPVHPAIMRALQAANDGHAAAYGADGHTSALTSAFSRLFERDVAVFPVATGTAANALALANLTHPFGGVICHEVAHGAVDECGAPEFFTGGAKLLLVKSPDGKITPSQISAHLDCARRGGVHTVLPEAVSLTQATEWGTVYSVAELSALGALCRAEGLQVHMDGARFANALCHLECTPADLTWRAGVDVLSFGATKNGALAAEAVVFFDPARAAHFARHRKRGGHLWSKMRFVSAQLLALLDGDVWRSNARHANRMAGELATRLAAIPGARLVHPVQANAVFVTLPPAIVAGLRAAGAQFYDWSKMPGEAGRLLRFVTCAATESAEIDALIATVERLQ